MGTRGPLNHRGTTLGWFRLAGLAPARTCQTKQHRGKELDARVHREPVHPKILVFPCTAKG